jgi:hypothetical protein
MQTVKNESFGARVAIATFGGLNVSMLGSPILGMTALNPLAADQSNRLCRQKTDEATGSDLLNYSYTSGHEWTWKKLDHVSVLLTDG